MGDKQIDIGDCGGDAAVGILGVGGLEAADGTIAGICVMGLAAAVGW